MKISKMGMDCMEVIAKFYSGELTKEEKYLEFMALDKKYPGMGFYEAGQKYAQDQQLRQQPTRDKKMESAGDYEEVPF